MMKRLFSVVLAVTVLGMALAAGFTKHKSTNIVLKYVKFAAVYTNLTQVEYFTGNTGTAGAIQNADEVAGSYFPATEAGIVNCIDQHTSDLPSSYDVTGTASSISVNFTCNFYPNKVSNNGFQVIGYKDLSSHKAPSDEDATDGELLIITNSSSFHVSTSISTSTTPPSGVTLKAFAGYVGEHTSGQYNIYDASGNLLSAGQALSSFSPNQSKAFSTQYSFAKIIPILMYAQVDPLSVPASANITYTVTWNGAAL